MTVCEFNARLSPKRFTQSLCPSPCINPLLSPLHQPFASASCLSHLPKPFAQAKTKPRDTLWCQPPPRLPLLPSSYREQNPAEQCRSATLAIMYTFKQSHQHSFNAHGLETLAAASLLGI